MENKLYVSPSPHIHGGDSISKNMYGVLIALVPAFLVSLYFFGLGALIVTVASVFFCVLFEYLIQKFLMKKEPTIYDGSAILTGVLLAFNLPSNLPIWIIAIGALAAIGIGKMSFGGLGNNIFTPDRTYLPADLFPGTDDHLARCRTVDILCRCNNRGNRPLSDERGCTRQNAYTQRHADR